ncbi:MAG TPA: KH domain-containing protein [Candidatus Eremiobacteraceae bacterium]|nr:KH domain-containing protein [Candidatus Eremiobacteraceae bacterium]
MTPVPSLVEQIARALVDRPETVQVEAVEGTEVTVLELRTDPQDTGKVIGRQGRTAKAIRTLLGAMGTKLHKRFMLDIVEKKPASATD